ncbi:hypothetical protein KC909_02890 [Candidatus Dojkabacteria bacterium]|uniref:Uncharacterized protein n=1 Tax=Candidatus Dojkabacteria bacterium TaxID=2099670 RepID=A0A955L5B6_9BACT|nr:hypothetical protein [Candidatus Dojkabacteria bacterium]
MAEFLYDIIINATTQGEAPVENTPTNESALLRTYGIGHFLAQMSGKTWHSEIAREAYLLDTTMDAYMDIEPQRPRIVEINKRRTQGQVDMGQESLDDNYNENLLDKHYALVISGPDDMTQSDQPIKAMIMNDEGMLEIVEDLRFAVEQGFTSDTHMYLTEEYMYLNDDALGLLAQLTNTQGGMAPLDRWMEFRTATEYDNKYAKVLLPVAARLLPLVPIAANIYFTAKGEASPLWCVGSVPSTAFLYYFCTSLSNNRYKVPEKNNKIAANHQRLFVEVDDLQSEQLSF